MAASRGGSGLRYALWKLGSKGLFRRWSPSQVTQLKLFLKKKKKMLVYSGFGEETKHRSLETDVFAQQLIRTGISLSEDSPGPARTVRQMDRKLQTEGQGLCDLFLALQELALLLFLEKQIATLFQFRSGLPLYCLSPSHQS